MDDDLVELLGPILVFAVGVLVGRSRRRGPPIGGRLLTCVILAASAVGFVLSYRATGTGWGWTLAFPAVMLWLWGLGRADLAR